MILLIFWKGQLPDGVLADLGDQLSDELSLAATGNGNSGNWAGNGSNNGTSESRSNDDLAGTIGNEDAVSGDRPEGLALPLGLLGINLLEGVPLLRGRHKVSNGRGQDTAEKLEWQEVKIYQKNCLYWVEGDRG